jgi:antitoxin (DNA-binding transcriptional repressor) of toxin-antitoxin stability system
METLTVGELKSQFSHVLDMVKDGREIAISYGRNHTKVAKIVPYAPEKEGKKRKLGLLAEKGVPRFADDFEMTDEELLGA